MFALPLTLTDGITISLGNNAWTLDKSFLIYLLVAAIVGLVAEAIVGWRLPFGFVGAIIAALIGTWLLTKFIIISGVDDINVFGIPVIRALVGAIIMVLIWHLLTFGLWRGRGRSFYRYRQR